jgi:hypothetical protein
VPSFSLPPLLSWKEFLDAATAPPTIGYASSRSTDSKNWCGATWDEALQLAIDGWPLALEEANVSIAELRDHSGLSHATTVLEPSWDVTGAEVDVGAYLSGIPECMVDAVPRTTSRRGKVVTFLIPATYCHRLEHDVIINRGLALATLCAAIIDAGHSVEIWSGYTGWLHTPVRRRLRVMARVIEAGEPFDVGRLIFTVAHPAMLRRLWFGVWDAQAPAVAATMSDNDYGFGPRDCQPSDLPAEITDPYVLPYLAEDDDHWNDLPTALSWSHQTFQELGLIHD